MHCHITEWPFVCMKRIVEDFPNVPEHRERLADSLFALGELLQSDEWIVRETNAGQAGDPNDPSPTDGIRGPAYTATIIFSVLPGQRRAEGESACRRAVAFRDRLAIEFPLD